LNGLGTLLPPEAVLIAATLVIPSERSETVVIPSERSESRDLR
jgi:hypothetical protein